MLKKKLGQTPIPHRKNTANIPPVTMSGVRSVLLPLSQHIGAPAVPIVKVGDEVKIGQMVAEASGAVSSPIFASISGKVTKIEDYLRYDGRSIPAIRIESDGREELLEGLCRRDINDLDGLIAASRDCGLVGLGGAGFPTPVKLAALKSGRIDKIVINGAECEPYITSDTRTMLDRSEWIYRGIALLETYCEGIDEYIFGIEGNKKACICAMRSLFKTNPKVTVKSLPSLYPQGAEKVMIYNTTGRIVPEGGLPSDVGVVVINVTTLAYLARFIETGVPLVERCVTVDGSAAAAPKNILAPIGVSVGELIEFAGGTKGKVGKVLFGGPMMGNAISSLDEPITKTTGAVTVMCEARSLMKKETACIHCGRCISACPLSLNPTEYTNSLEIFDTDERIARLEKYKVSLCMECGCCSFVCPARRPLVENNRLAKGEVRAYHARAAMLKN